MNKDCIFFRSNRCAILKNIVCDKKCKFKKTHDEFIEEQEKANIMLKNKHLAPMTKKVGNNIIMTTKEIYEDEDKSN